MQCGEVELEKKIDEKIEQFVCWVEKHPNKKSQVCDLLVVFNFLCLNSHPMYVIECAVNAASRAKVILIGSDLVDFSHKVLSLSFWMLFLCKALVLRFTVACSVFQSAHKFPLS